MPGDVLRSLPGLQESHRRALADKLGITSFQALADADQRAVYAALANIRPRPSLTRIAAWQDEVRSRLAGLASDRSAWQTAASFAVIFSKRQAGGDWELRLEAEQTETEPAAEPGQWPGWDCGPLCDWMLARLARAEDSAGSRAGSSSPAGTAGRSDAVAGREPGTQPEPARAGAATLAIDAATITDARHELELIRAGEVIAAPADDLCPPVRLSLSVRGGRSGGPLRAAVWFRRRGRPGWSPQEPVIVASSGRAEFDLSAVPPGGHDLRLLVWATNRAAMTAVALPTLTFGQRARQDGDVAAALPGP